MSLASSYKRLFTILMIVAMLAGLVPAVSPLGPLTAQAQAEPAFIRWVRAIETSDLGIAYPAGLAFSPGARAFYVLEARNQALPPPSDFDILQVTPFEDRGPSARILASVRNPINVAYDQEAGRLLIFQAAPDKLIEVQETAEGYLDPATLVRHDARAFGLQDPQGMVVDPALGHLFILDSSGPRIVRIEPDGDGGFAGAQISEIDLSQAGLPAIRGLALDPSSGHFYVLSPGGLVLYEVAPSGQVVTTRDLDGLGLVDPQGLVLAPSADTTDDPGQMHLYIADSGPFTEQTLEASQVESSLDAGAADSSLDAGVGNVAQGSGNIAELSFEQPEALGPITWMASLVKTTDTANYNPPSPDPSGLAYVPGSETLLMCDGEVEETVGGVTHFEGTNVWETRLDNGAVVHTANVSSVSPTQVPMTNEPTGVAWNPSGGGHYYFTDDNDKEVYGLSPGPDGELGTGDDTWTSFDTATHGSGDPEGIAYDSATGRLFVVDGVNAEVYEYTLSGNLVGQFDVAAFGIPDPEGVEYNPINDTLFVLSSNSSARYAVETTKSGSLLGTIDIGASSAKAAAGLAYAPASNGSGEMRLYIVDRAVDNNYNPDIIDGKMFEMTMPPTGPVAPTANDDSAGTLKDIPVTIDVAANDSDLNGNLDPTTTNTGCAACSEPSSGTLVNNGNGTFDYTPNTGYLGSDAFVYEICDTDSLCDTASVSINIGEAVVDVRVAGSWDDAEEGAGGSIDLTSSDLELVYDAGVDQTGGLRFRAIDVPQGATITNAYVQFKVDEVSTGSGISLLVEGQDADNALAFSSTTNDITSRARTTASVDWTPPPWPSVGIAGADQRTPNIAPVIQEIVGRSGWTSGNSLVLIISGTGERVAEAYNGDAAGAPLLHVEYSTSGAGNSPPVANDDSGMADEDTTTTLDVAANDSDVDGNLDATSANTGCATCSDTTAGTLVNNGNGSFGYTPDPNFNGSDSFVYEICDDAGACDTATASISVSAVDDAPVASDDSATTDEDTAATIDVAANDSDVDGDLNPTSANTTCATCSGTTSGTLVNNGNGTFGYTPNPDYNGSDGFVYEICDDAGSCVTASVDITVNAVNDVPVANDDSGTTDEDTATTINVAANDSDVDGDLDVTSANTGCTYGSIGCNGATFGTLVDNGDGTITYTPNPNYNGADSFVYEICDVAGACDTATASITVSAVDDAPVANDDSALTSEDTTVIIDVAANDSDVDGDLDPSTANTTCGTCSLPSNGALVNNGNGTFDYIPNTDFSGGDSFVYQICDQGSPVQCDTATVSVTVTVANDPPVANDDSASTDEDTPTTINVAANDSDIDGNLDAASANSDCATCNLPSNGNLVNNVDGTFSYTPNADYSGPDSFVYEICDLLAACDTATVNITVTAVADPPVANDDSATTPEDTATTINVATNDTDADGNLDSASTNTDCVTCSVPSNGSLVNNGNGTFDYTPNPNFNGDDSFVYEICDLLGACDTATVSITVTPGNDSPVANDDSASTDEDTPATINVSANDSDIDGNLDAASANTDCATCGVPSNGNLVNNVDGTFSYTPNADYNGPDGFVYEICDLLAACDTATVNITVNAVADPPVANDDSATAPEDTATTINVATNDTDADGNLDPATANTDCTTCSVPSNGSLVNNSNGTFDYTPILDYNGPDGFVYEICDLLGACDTATVSITVTPGNDPPVANDDSATTDEDTATTIDVAANDTDLDGNLDAASANTGCATCSVPSNGNLVNNVDGTFSYTPNLDYNGPDSFVYEICDLPGACDTATVNITVAPINDAPVANDDSAAVAEDTLVVIDVAANDSDVDGNLNPASANSTCAYGSAGCSGAANGSLTDNGNGTITYTPNPDYYGSDSFVYEICDTDLACDVATVAVTVNQSGPGSLDVRVSSGNDDAEENASGRVSLTSSDLELVFDRVDQVVGVRFNGVTIPQGATITDAYLQFKADEVHSGATALTIEAEASDNAVIFDNISYNISSRPRTGSVSWTPDPWPTRGEAGAAQQAPGLAPIIQEVINREGWVGGNSLVIIITGSGERAAESFNGDQAGAPLLHVDYIAGPPNEPPVAVDDNPGTDEDTPVTINVAANDTDPESNLNMASANTDCITCGVPLYGNLVNNGNGTFDYSPNLDYNGPDSFVYEICDQGTPTLCDTATVNITVDPVDDPPVANDDGALTSEGTPVIIDVADNDTDADLDLDLASANTGCGTCGGPDNGSLVDNNDGTFTYSPNGTYNGPDSFVYEICDQGNPAQCDTALVSITVTVANDPPVANDDSATTDEDTLQNIDVAANDTDSDGNLDATSANTGCTSCTLPSNGNLVNKGDGTFDYTPNPDYNGPDGFVYEICDLVGACDTAQVSITVAAVNDAPVANDDSASTFADTLVTIDVAANDTDVDSSLDLASANTTCAGCSGPANGSLVDMGDGTFDYTPNPSYTGGDSFVYEICDSGGACDTAQVSITVDPLTPTVVQVRVSASSDDAEENNSGRVSLTSSDLEFVYDKGNYQVVGMRFNGVAVPPGATIVNAYLQFQADETHSDPVTLLIAAEASDNAVTFDNTTNNISNRPRTGSVSWMPDPWTKGQAGDAQRTPQLAQVVQEVVQRQGWASGNSLVMIITEPTGTTTDTQKRVAESYNGNGPAAPLLYIEYLPGG